MFLCIIQCTGKITFSLRIRPKYHISTNNSFTKRFLELLCMVVISGLGFIRADKTFDLCHKTLVTK